MSRSLVLTALPASREAGALDLGPWCRLFGEPGQRPPVLPSPWHDEAAARRALERGERAYETALAQLAAALNEAHGRDWPLRSWRILVGPWLLGLVSALNDRLLHLEAAFAADPGLEASALDPADFITPRHTHEHTLWLVDDGYNLQLFSHALAALGRRPRALRLALSDLRGLVADKQGTARALAAAVSRLRRPRAVFAELNVERPRAFELAFAGRGRLWPFVAGPHAWPAPDRERRARLPGSPGEEPLLRALWTAIPHHLPTAYLEGFSELKRAVDGSGARGAETLLTSTGWFFNEPFKWLCADATARGARLVIAQHGGGYGMFDPMQTEFHERAVADEYWTWGWTEPATAAAPARTRPMPAPKLAGLDGLSRAPGEEWVLITNDMPRYTYSWFVANYPHWHRFEGYLEDRERFIGTLPEAARSALRVRLHPQDRGWRHKERLAARWPTLRLDPHAVPWRERLERVRLVVSDCPQTAYIEALAADVPTILFWRPGMWAVRPSAEGPLDGLRRAGILYDDPAAAAAAAARALQDASWWSRPAVQEARRAFCARYGSGAPDWARRWSRALRGSADA